MKPLLILGTLLITLGCTFNHKDKDMNSHSHHGNHHRGHAHEHGPKVGAKLVIATDPADPVAGRPITLRLMIHAADGTMVKNFEEVHGEKVHIVIVREGLDHFAHIHPAVDAKGNLTVSYTFPAGGKHLLFADYTLAGGEHATATGSVQVGGDSPPAPALTPNVPGEIEADGIRATISAAPLKAGKPAHVAFVLREQGGGPAGLEPYMGALGHLMFVSAAGQYVHVHPVAGDAARGKIEFEAHFPKPGLYKGWGQFKRSGQVRVVPFVLQVE